MITEQEILDSVKIQLEHNSNKNLFYNGENDNLTLSQKTIEFIENKKDDLREYLRNNIKPWPLNKITDQALEVFYKSNQYISFTSNDISRLQVLYKEFFNNIFLYVNSESLLPLSNIVSAHYNNLKEWIAETNPFIKIVNKNTPYVQEVICSEYSSQLQLSLLDLDVDTLKEPVLDIGCGLNANLVLFLRKNGIEAFGIDRLKKSKSGFITKADWLEYDFGTEKWGTVISNMSFTNHFVHHHFRNDGRFKEYAVQYHNIINSLIHKGSFIYSPSLPFIEEFIDLSHFNIEIKKDKLSNEFISMFGITKITRK